MGATTKDDASPEAPRISPLNSRRVAADRPARVIEFQSKKNQSDFTQNHYLTESGDDIWHIPITQPYQLVSRR